MSEPITASLRLFITSSIDDDLSPSQRDRLFELCRQIDAVDRNLQKEAEDLAEYARAVRRDSVELPKDAEGEFIRVGDYVRSVKPSLGAPFYVEQMILAEDGWLIQSDESDNAFAPDELVHVEMGVRELLAEFVVKVSNGECVTIRSGLLDEYVERIRKAGGD